MKIIRNIGIVLFIIMNILLFTYFVMNENIPETTQGIEAERLADKLLLFVNKDAWDQTQWLKFQAMGKKRYIWDKKRKLVQAEWNDYSVSFHTSTGKGIVKDEGIEVTGEKKKKILKKAHDSFNNDSFWFFAPFKIKDPGTTLSYKPINDTLDGLLINYSTGGTTPGDSYLWAINKDGIPRYWQMWTSNIPIGGMTTRWNNWKPLKSGAQIARERKIWLMELNFERIVSGDNPQDIGLNQDPFLGIEAQL